MAQTFYTVDDLDTGDVLPETWVDQVKANLDNFIVPPVVRLTAGTVTSTGNAAFTTITWDTEVIDTDGMWSSGTAATVQTSGVYMVGASITWDANATGDRSMNVAVNGTARIVAEGKSATVTTTFAPVGLLSLTAGQVLGVRAFQNSGGNLNVGTSPYSPVLWAQFVGLTSAP